MDEQSLRLDFLANRPRHPPNDAVTFLENRIQVPGQAQPVFVERLNRVDSLEVAEQQQKIRYGNAGPREVNPSTADLHVSAMTCGSKPTKKRLGYSAWLNRFKPSLTRRAEAAGETGSFKDPHQELTCNDAPGTRSWVKSKARL